MVYARLLRAAKVPQSDTGDSEKLLSDFLSDKSSSESTEKSPFAQLTRMDKKPIPIMQLINLNGEIRWISDAIAKYVLPAYYTCLDDMKMKPEEFNVPRNDAEKQYDEFLQNSARGSNDDWYYLHIIFLACTWVSDTHKPGGL
jgi:hypothetical protein